MIFALLLVLVLLAVVSLALDAYRRSQGPRTFVRRVGPGSVPGIVQAGEALGVLAMRYARGEVSRADYLQARADLGGPPDDVDAPTGVTPAEETPLQEPKD
jgi:hypothetical protein